MGHVGTKSGQTGAKMGQVGAQIDQDDPKIGQDGPKIGQDGPKIGQDGANCEDFFEFGIFCEILTNIEKKNVFLCFFSILQYNTTLLSHREQENFLIEPSTGELLPTASIGELWRPTGLEIHLPNALESR